MITENPASLDMAKLGDTVTAQLADGFNQE
jgi:hypothetical protein